MKKLHKKCKTLKQVNSYLKKVGLEDFTLDESWLIYKEEYDFDGWVNEEETKGVSIIVTEEMEVFISKYTKKDIELLEAAL